MGDTGTVVQQQTPRRKTAAKGNKKAKKPASDHPKIDEMVTSAIKGLNERKGSSLIAIKKYISSSYDVDVEKLAPFIKRHIKSAVAARKLVQTKGKGASGSFKLISDTDKKPAPRIPQKPAPKKAKSPRSSKGKSKRSPIKAKTPRPKKTTKRKASSAPKQTTK